MPEGCEFFHDLPPQPCVERIGIVRVEIEGIEPLSEGMHLHRPDQCGTNPVSTHLRRDHQSGKPGRTVEIDGEFMADEKYRAGMSAIYIGNEPRFRAVPRQKVDKPGTILHDGAARAFEEGPATQLGCSLRIR